MSYNLLLPVRKEVGHIIRKTKRKSMSTYNRLFSPPKIKDVLFFHIPRTGGTSINRSLYKYGHRKLNKPELYKDFNNKGFVTFGHVNVFYLLEKGILSQEYFEKAFKFAFVRNPWERLVSLYFYRKNIADKKLSNLAPWISNCSFLEFCKTIEKKGIPEISKYNVKDISQANPQVNWLLNDKGKLVVDFVGKFENLNSDFKKICKIIGITTKLPNTNKTKKKKNYREYYTKESKKIVEKIYFNDIKRFGYKF